MKSFLLSSAILVAATAPPISGPVIGTTPATRVGNLTPELNVPFQIPEVDNLSTCRHLNREPIYTIIIPALSYNCPVYIGQQGTIDEGAVTLWEHFNPFGWAMSLQPDQMGTHYLAAHRSTHGSPFYTVPNLHDGASIILTDGTYSQEYVVVGRRSVTVDANGQVISPEGVDIGTSILRDDQGGPYPFVNRITLQTCDGPSLRWMVYADRVH